MRGQFIRRCHPYARKVRLTSGSSRMQLTLHATRRTPHGASRLVLAMSAWSVKTRRAPSWHCRDARVYGHTTTAMHMIMSTHLHTPSCSRCQKCSWWRSFCGPTMSRPVVCCEVLAVISCPVVTRCWQKTRERLDGGMAFVTAQPPFFALLPLISISLMLRISLCSGK